jgi:hypothetical protein
MMLLDFIYRVEKRFRMRISLPEFTALLERHAPPDISVGEFCALVRRKLDLPPREAAQGADALFGPTSSCSRCGYCLNTLPLNGRCPECGLDLAMEGSVEGGVRRDLCDAAGVSPDQVTPGKLLLADLGMKK